MNILLRSIGIVVALLWCHHLNGQDCLSFTDSIYLRDQIDTTIVFTVYNLDSTDLTANQEVCGVSIHFGTEYPRDLQITLESPAGDQIILIGPVSNTSNDVLIGTSWDISFVPLDTTPIPDAGYASTWSNDQGWVGGLFGFEQIYTGSYYPHDGALRDFNSGHAYGEWKLRIIDAFEFHDSFIKSFSIELCNPGGIDCSECYVEADTVMATTIELCEGDLGLAFEYDQFLTDTSALDMLGDSIAFRTVIVQNDTVIQYQSDSVDLITFLPGEYDIYGLYHLNSDSTDIPKANRSFTIDSLRIMTDSFPRIYCGDITEDAVTVTIRPLHLTSVTEILCFNDSLTVGDTVLNNTGLYTIVLEDQFGCDSTVFVDLTISPEIVTTIDTVLCFGDSIFVRNTWFNASTTMTDTLTAQNGCDSLVSLVLQVNDRNFTELDIEICSGDAYTLFGTAYTNTGVYRDSMPDSFGCDSIVILNLDVVSEFVVDTTSLICIGDSFLIGDQAYTSPGMYTDTLQSSLGCDSTVHLELIVLDPVLSTVNETLCFGDSIAIGNTFYNSTGTYVDTLESSLGCDSIVTLNLDFLSFNSSNQTTTICFGDSILSAVRYYSIPGTYIDTIMDINSCDSIVTLNLDVRPENRIMITDTICSGDMYMVGDSTYANPGMYTTILDDQYGCDSIVDLDLFVLPTFRLDTLSAICFGDSFMIGDVAYTSSGSYVDTIASSNGCDSIINLDLTVIDPIQTILIESLCFGDSIAVNGNYFDSTGVYVDTLVSALGCDSIVTLDLTIRLLNGIDLMTSICFGDSILSGGNYYSQPGIYIDTLMDVSMCDSVVILNLNVRPENRVMITETICIGDSYMVGDSAYSNSGMYTNILVDQYGCDSIVDLNLLVLPQFNVDTTSTICFGDSFVVGQMIYKTTGMYLDTLTSTIGCDSIIDLELIVVDPVKTSLVESLCFGDSIAVGDHYYMSTGLYVDTLSSSLGCDSIVTLDLTIRPMNGSDLVTSICFGDSTLSGGNYYSQPGIYIDTLTDVNICDSIVILNLDIRPENRVMISGTICIGESYIVGDSAYTNSGMYTSTLVDQYGCDSIVDLNLFVLPQFNVDTTSIICFGDSFVVGEMVYKTSGMYLDTLTSTIGCDSIIDLELIVVDPIQITLVESLCFGDSIAVGDIYYKSAGVFVDTLSSSLGCDSIVMLDLIIRPPNESVHTTTICFGDSIRLGGSYFNQTGTYIDTLTDVNMCDSVVILNLDVRPENRIMIATTICEGDFFMVGESTYSTSGIYTTILGDQNGCDSIVDLDLHVLPQFNVDTTSTICVGDSFMIGEKAYKTTGRYLDTLTSTIGCDSIIDLDLIVVDPIQTILIESLCFGDSIAVGNTYYSISGNYTDTLQSVIGCDSIVQLELTTRPSNGSALGATICFGDSIISGNGYYSNSGIFVEALTDVYGCDSIVTLDLLVLPENRQMVNDTICFADTYAIGDSVFMASGSYTTILEATNGCDSIVDLELFVLPQVTGLLDSSICRGESVQFNGSVFSNSGQFEIVYERDELCDSTLFLNLTVIEPTNTFLSEAICEGESYIVGPSTYFAEGIHIDTLSSSSGCDSIVHLNLTVNEIFLTNIPNAICEGDSISFDNVWLKEKGFYYDTLTSVSGCDSIIEFELAVLSLDDPIQLIDSICIGDSLFFNEAYITEAGIYRDTLQTSLSCDSVVVLDLRLTDDIYTNISSNLCLGDTLIYEGEELASSGMYPFVFQSRFGCDSTVTIDLLVERCAIDLQVNEQPPSCKGTSDGEIFFRVDYGEAPYLYRLYHESNNMVIDEGMISDFGGTAQIFNLDFGQYILAIIDNTQDSVGAMVSFATTTPFQFSDVRMSDFNGYGVSCPGDANGTVEFAISGGIEPYSVLWQDGATGNSRSNLTAGPYAAFIQDNEGCQDTFAVEITSPDSIRFDLEIGPASCQGNEDGSIAVSNISGGVGGFDFSLGDGFQPENLFPGLIGGTYTIAVMDANACEVELDVEITQPTDFIFDLGPDVTLDAFGIISLDIQTNRMPQSFTWSPAIGLSCLDCLNPDINVTASTVYRVKAVDEFGCSVEDEIIVLVDIDRSIDPAMAFTPNGDDNNDLFIVHGDSTIDIIENIEIYNRSGAMVFKQESFPVNDPAYGWDGTFNGQPLNTQLLIYFIEVVYVDGKTKIFSGEISLIR